VDKLIDETLLESVFRSAVKRIYGNVSLNLIKKRLFEKYGISLHHAVNDDFEKIEDVVSENFSDGVNSIKIEMLNSIISLQQGSKSNNGKIVENPQNIKNIMHIFKDDECKIILQEIAAIPQTINELVHTTGLSQTSIYRKISNMKKENLVKSEGFKITDQSKIPRYVACFNDIKITVNTSKITAHIF